MQVYDKLYIGGEWIEASHRAGIEVIHAATEEVIGVIPSAGREEVDAAVNAARQALPAWANLSPAERREHLVRLHAGLTASGAAIARTISAEVGMPLKLSERIQAGLPPLILESYIKLLEDYPFTEEVGNSLILKEPRGVVGCITPWNYPLHQVVAKIAPALAAGCTLVVKPSEQAPLSAFRLAEIAQECGLPPGVFNLVSGYGPEAGEALVRHPEVRMISFTGSTRAGRRISELAAATAKRITLEMGGKSPSLILPDADLGKAVKATVASCFLNSGQTCSALTRMLVHKSQYEQAAALAVEIAGGFSPGDPLAPDTRLGPLVSAAQRERVRDYIRQGQKEGARLLCGGEEPPVGLERGFYVQPTVFGDVNPHMTIAREEIFGPVLVILAYEDEEQAIAIANDSDYGLAAAVWSGDAARAEQLARRIEAGQVDINGGRFNPLAPFGGFKQSGIGREFGRWGLEEFFEIKSLQR
ncbi:aldehyde dehydrogenase family protein [Geoalkalibacter halelectricus]|uniref:aldehyde dehydrogenase (NAD(+)) n=1 Tax=Geoalkalibacter halelectricus TaxID=2847045 RepID=A0ABY5ZRI2_9BACT|nr:aldehyde dehydrogenase family protein [Geoalkalibacter halelectricus]MDO3379916.1 aldehyde dehydrogenase family protein [Geoalkalibacter halelectricus]UWZ80557.1 aldehyde dehydrogenase family protein [Geoalkalibacter halelectricus]